MTSTAKCVTAEREFKLKFCRKPSEKSAKVSTAQICYNQLNISFSDFLANQHLGICLLSTLCVSAAHATT